MPYRVTTYQDALDFIGVRPNDKIKQIFLRLSGEGRNEKSIAYSIWKEHQTIMKFRGDPRFYSVLENSIKKWSWARDDPRWKEYAERKKQEEEAAKYKQANKHSYESIKRSRDIKAKKYPGFIYFIQGKSSGAVKIGYTVDVFKRLKGLQTGYPDTLIIRCCIPGSPDTESGYHEMFKEERLKGEWFKPSEKLMKKIDALVECVKREDDTAINLAVSKDLKRNPMVD